MGRVVFEVNEVFEAIVRHALATKEHSPAFADLFRGEYRHDGRDIPLDSPELPSLDEVDMKKIPPAVMLVKDHGVYLMSNGVPRQIDPADPEGQRSVVLYARGMNPNEDPDWYDRAHDAVGGDDFGEPLPIEWFQDALERGAKRIELVVSSSKIVAVYTGTRADRNGDDPVPDTGLTSSPS